MLTIWCSWSLRSFSETSLFSWKTCLCRWYLVTQALPHSRFPLSLYAHISLFFWSAANPKEKCMVSYRMTSKAFSLYSPQYVVILKFNYPDFSLHVSPTWSFQCHRFIVNTYLNSYFSFLTIWLWCWWPRNKGLLCRICNFESLWIIASAKLIKVKMH